MPKIIKLTLTKAQLTELNQLAVQADLPARVRVRLEMVRLSHLGFVIPQIAEHLEQHHQTVRKYLHAFTSSGFAGLWDQPHPGLKPRLSEAQLQSLEAHLDKVATEGERTYTLSQLAEWLEQTFQVKLSPYRLGEILRASGFRYKRTKRSVKHKQTDPLLKAAKQADLETFNLKAVERGWTG